MKRLIITEEEKKRILGMHNSRRISEQQTQTAVEPKQQVTSPTSSVATGDASTTCQPVPNDVNITSFYQPPTGYDKTASNYIPIAAGTYNVKQAGNNASFGGYYIVDSKGCYTGYIICLPDVDPNKTADKIKITVNERGMPFNNGGTFMEEGKPYDREVDVEAIFELENNQYPTINHQGTR